MLYTQEKLLPSLGTALSRSLIFHNSMLKTPFQLFDNGIRSFRFLESEHHLDETWYHDAEREAHCIIYGFLFTMEEIDELAIALWQDIGQDERHGIVDPMK